MQKRRHHCSIRQWDLAVKRFRLFSRLCSLRQQSCPVAAHDGLEVAVVLDSSAEVGVIVAELLVEHLARHLALHLEGLQQVLESLLLGEAADGDQGVVCSAEVLAELLDGHDALHVLVQLRVHGGDQVLTLEAERSAQDGEELLDVEQTHVGTAAQVHDGVQVVVGGVDAPVAQTGLQVLPVDLARAEHLQLELLEEAAEVPEGVHAARLHDLLYLQQDRLAVGGRGQSAVVDGRLGTVRRHKMPRENRSVRL
mmetsp:Transcript_6272/g.13956  ORF Transcript_6272/g.13956 Transcript_6272/m.13956 type:complete len:253 (-) Transcript_6272:960-1718(-)